MPYISWSLYDWEIDFWYHLPQTPNIRRTNPQNIMFLVSFFTVFCLIHWGWVLSREWRWSLSSTDKRCSNYNWVINNFITQSGESYISGLTLVCMWSHCTWSWDIHWIYHLPTGTNWISSQPLPKEITTNSNQYQNSALFWLIIFYISWQVGTNDVFRKSIWHI